MQIPKYDDELQVQALEIVRKAKVQIAEHCEAAGEHREDMVSTYALNALMLAAYELAAANAIPEHVMMRAMKINYAQFSPAQDEYVH